MNLAEPPLRYVLIFAVNVAFYMLFALLSYRAKSVEHGWHRVGPGWSHWVAMALAPVIVAFLSLMAMHSGWPPAEGEYLIFYALMALFLGATIWLPIYTLSIRRTDLWWRDDWIAFTDRHSGRVVQDMRDIVEAYERWDQYIVLKFSDGGQVKIDPYCSGAEQLCEAIHGQIGPVSGIRVGHP